MKLLKIYLQLFLFSLGILLNGQLPNDYSLYFDGGDEVIIPHNNSLNLADTSEFTIELWFKNTGNLSVYHILGKRGGNCSHSYMNYQISRDNNTNLHFGSCFDVISTGQNAPYNEWIHYAVTYKEHLLKLYLNGKLKAVSPFNMCGITDDPLRFGNTGTCPDYMRFIGYIDDIRMWNVARDSNEIAYFYNRKINPDPEKLIGYWSFNEDTSSQKVIDYSVNKNNGFLGVDTLKGSDDPKRVISNVGLLNDNHDIELTSVNDIDQVVQINDTISPKIKIRNNGLTAETVDVNLILDVFYRDTKKITLEPGETKKIIFRDYIASEIGSYSCLAYLTSVNDGFNHNDTIKANFSITESYSDPVILSVSPKDVGYDNIVTIKLLGLNLSSITELTFRRGTDSISFQQKDFIQADSLSITVIYQFEENDKGIWDIELSDSVSRKVFSYIQAFTVKEPLENLTVDLIGRSLIRVNRDFEYRLIIRNKSNFNIRHAYLILNFSNCIKVELLQDISSVYSHYGCQNDMKYVISIFSLYNLDANSEISIPLIINSLNSSRVEREGVNKLLPCPLVEPYVQFSRIRLSYKLRH